MLHSITQSLRARSDWMKKHLHGKSLKLLLWIIKIFPFCSPQVSLPSLPSHSMARAEPWFLAYLEGLFHATTDDTGTAHWINECEKVFIIEKKMKIAQRFVFVLLSVYFPFYKWHF